MSTTRRPLRLPCSPSSTPCAIPKAIAMCFSPNAASAPCRISRPCRSIRRAAPAPDTQMLYKYLRAFGGVSVPHTSAPTMGTDWRDNDPAVEPVVEIYQGGRQSYEKEGGPAPPDPTTPSGCVQLGRAQRRFEGQRVPGSARPSSDCRTPTSSPPPPSRATRRSHLPASRHNNTN